MLKGAYLSKVQSYAVELILIGEQRVKALEDKERFKLAVLSADPAFWLPKLFPELAPQSEEEDDVLAPGVEWVFPQITEEEAQRMLDEFRAQRGGTITLDEIDESDWV